MDNNATTSRRGPLDGRVAGAAGVSVVPARPAYRILLRAGSDGLTEISAALRVDLPTAPKQSKTSGSGRMALWLGPDEWLLIDENADPMEALEKTTGLISAVDVSHRNTAIELAGPGACATLEAGCPQDLSDRAFPVGACSRTVLGKIEVVILRTGNEAFRVECWRSFADYAFAFLTDAAQDCMA